MALNLCVKQKKNLSKYFLLYSITEIDCNISERLLLTSLWVVAFSTFDQYFKDKNFAITTNLPALGIHFVESIRST